MEFHALLLKSLVDANWVPPSSTLALTLEEVEVGEPLRMSNVTLNLAPDVLQLPPVNVTLLWLKWV